MQKGQSDILLTICGYDFPFQIECDGSGTSTNKQVRVVVLDNSYVCGYCQEKFTTFFQLKTHMVLHKSEQVFFSTISLSRCMCSVTFDVVYRCLDVVYRCLANDHVLSSYLVKVFFIS